MPLFENHTFYKKALKEYGVSPQGVHWSSKYSQYKRFEVLTDFIVKEISQSSLVDVGCGFAEYFQYLKRFELQPLHYIGVDCERFMIDKCKHRFPSQKFLVKDILQNQLPQADYYVCSGAMNILTEKEFYKFLDICFEHCTKGFLFNFLIEDSFNDVQKKDVLKYCESLPCSVSITDGYLYNDMSVYLKKH